MPSFAYTTPFPPGPKTPFTYVVYLYSDINCLKGILGLSRGARDSKIGKKWPESSRILDYILS